MVALFEGLALASAALYFLRAFIECFVFSRTPDTQQVFLEEHATNQVST
jgi:hypothetical protein